MHRPRYPSDDRLKLLCNFASVGYNVFVFILLFTFLSYRVYCAPRIHFSAWQSVVRGPCVGEDMFFSTDEHFVYIFTTHFTGFLCLADEPKLSVLVYDKKRTTDRGTKHNLLLYICDTLCTLEPYSKVNETVFSH